MHHTLPDLVTIRELAREAPQFSEPSLRDLVYHAEPRIRANGEHIPANGFGVCIIRVGARILIDRHAFAAWIEARRMAPLSDTERVAA